MRTILKASSTAANMVIEITSIVFKSDSYLLSKIKKVRSLQDLISLLPDKEIVKTSLKLKEYKLNSNKKEHFLTTNKSIHTINIPMRRQNDLIEITI